MVRTSKTGAGNGIRTRDPQLGRLTLYQLSYSRPQRLAVLRLAGLTAAGVSYPASCLLAPKWGGEDSNLRRPTPADLQSAPFGRSGTSPHTYYTRLRVRDRACGSTGRRDEKPYGQSWRRDLNPRPADYKSAALPLSYASPARTRYDTLK
jgi:hypothetical protein